MVHGRAAARIEELGDPAFIAAEARAGASEPARPVLPGATSQTWHIVLTSLLVAFGGVGVPIDPLTMTMLLLLGVPPVIGIWLLWRGLRRGRG